MLDYLITNYPVDPDAVGVAGISYGSGIGLIGAAQDDRIRAVSAMSTWGDLEQSLYGNQTPRLVWGELLTLTSELLGNPDPIIAENWKKIQVDLELVSTAYDVPAGHKVVLAVDTKDPQYLSPTDYNYFVDFEFSNRHQSVLKIPVL